MFWGGGYRFERCHPTPRIVCCRIPGSSHRAYRSHQQCTIRACTREVGQAVSLPGTRCQTAKHARLGGGVGAELHHHHGFFTASVWARRRHPSSLHSGVLLSGLGTPAYSEGRGRRTASATSCSREQNFMAGSPLHWCVWTLHPWRWHSCTDTPAQPWHSCARCG